MCCKSRRFTAIIGLAHFNVRFRTAERKHSLFITNLLCTEREHMVYGPYTINKRERARILGAFLGRLHDLLRRFLCAATTVCPETRLCVLCRYFFFVTLAQLPRQSKAATCTHTKVQCINVQGLMGTYSERVCELDFFLKFQLLSNIFLSRKFREIWAHIPRNRNKNLGDFF